jgi:hypothetical protein
VHNNRIQHRNTIAIVHAVPERQASEYQNTKTFDKGAGEYFATASPYNRKEIYNPQGHRQSPQNGSPDVSIRFPDGPIL